MHLFRTLSTSMLPSSNPKQRIKRLSVKAVILLLTGLFYLIVIKVFGRGLPCLFNKLTGLYCPGCGITRIIFSSVRLDFVAAFNANPVLFCFLPFLAAVLIYRAVRYIRCGTVPFTLWQKLIVYIGIVLLLLFCVYRNIMLFI